ncbi:hypothetical protein SESBI_13665 [Sesbania bispinosa]|nr:hypothetical protein SESBI_13665 [Sesbania bispinosa]
MTSGKAVVVRAGTGIEAVWWLCVQGWIWDIGRILVHVRQWLKRGMTMDHLEEAKGVLRLLVKDSDSRSPE